MLVSGQFFRSIPVSNMQQSGYKHEDASSRFRILSIIADGRIHSGADIAEQLNLTRAAIWKQIKQLQNTGLAIKTVRGQGYQLYAPLELLDSNRILASIESQNRSLLESIEIFQSIDSSNSRLLHNIQSGQHHAHVVLAEYQSHGRGRRGHRWLSPPASGICLSIGWHYEEVPADIACLSLSAGVAVIRALEKSGAHGAQLKWPNDIYHNESKLGGLLVESRIEHAGNCDIVLGLGLNYCLANDEQLGIEQDWTDVARVTGNLPGRNKLAGRLINELLNMFTDYAENGFAADIEQWRAVDLLKDRLVRIETTDESIMARVTGINEQGLLLAEVNGRSESFSSGEVSLRVSA